MSASPEVTIVTATYGPPTFLEATLDAARRQTLSNFELLVGDDSGLEETKALVESIGDERIAYLRNPNRLGPARNHRKLLTRARGRFVSILNQDDLWRPDFLEVMCSALRREQDAVLAFCDHEVIDEGGLPMEELTNELSARYGRSELRPGTHRPFEELVLRQTIPLAMGSVLANQQQIWRRLPAWSEGAYDLWIAAALACTGHGAIFLPERLSFWRTHSGSLTASGGMAGRIGALETWSRLSMENAFRSHRSALLRRSVGGWIRLWRDGVTRRRPEMRRAGSRGLRRLLRRWLREG
jgi:glycosyltransferase involved in cell wall biosynthesis